MTDSVQRIPQLDPGPFADSLALAREKAAQAVPLPPCGHDRFWWVATGDGIDCIACAPTHCQSARRAKREGTQ